MFNLKKHFISIISFLLILIHLFVHIHKSFLFSWSVLRYIYILYSPKSHMKKQQQLSLVKSSSNGFQKKANDSPNVKSDTFSSTVSEDSEALKYLKGLQKSTESKKLTNSPSNEVQNQKPENPINESLYRYYQAITNDPTNTNAYEKLIQQLIKIQKYDVAKYLCKKLKDVSIDLTYLYEGVIAFEEKKFDQSKSNFDRLINKRAKLKANYKISYYQALKCLLLNNYNESKNYIQTCIKASKESKDENTTDIYNDCLLCLGINEMFLKNYQNAIVCFQELDNNKKKSSSLVKYYLALISFLYEDYATCETYCEQIYAMDKTLINVDLLKGYIYFKKQMISDIFELNDKLSSMSTPESYKISLRLNLLIALFYSTNSQEINYAKSTIYFDTAVKLKNSSELLNDEFELITFTKCVILLKYNNDANVYKKILDTVTESKLAEFNISNFTYLIAFAYLKFNQVEDCLTYLNRTLKLDNKNINYHLAIIIVFIRNDGYKNAIACIENAIEILSSDLNFNNKEILYYYYSYCLVAIGNYDKAIQQLSIIANVKDKNNILKNFVLYDLKYECEQTRLNNTLMQYILEVNEATFLKLEHNYKLNLDLINVNPILYYEVNFKFNNANYLLLKGITEFYTKNYLKCIEVLDEAYKIDKNNFGIKCYLGLSYANKNELKLAEKYLLEVLEIKKQNSTYRMYYCEYIGNYLKKQTEIKLSNICMALVYYYLKEYDTAINILSDLLRPIKNLNQNYTQQPTPLTQFEVYNYYQILFKLLLKKKHFELLSKYINQAFNDVKSFDDSIVKERFIMKLVLYSSIINYWKNGENSYEKAYLDFNNAIRNSKINNALVEYYYALAIKKLYVNGSRLADKNHLVAVTNYLNSLLAKFNKKTGDLIVYDGKPNSNNSNKKIHDSEYDYKVVYNDFEIDYNEITFHLAQCYYLLNDYQSCQQCLNLIHVDKNNLNSFSNNAVEFYKALCLFKAWKVTKIDMYLIEARKLFAKIDEKNLEESDLDQDDYYFSKAICYYHCGDIEYHEITKEDNKEIPKEVTLILLNQLDEGTINRLDYLEYKLKTLVYLILLFKYDNKIAEEDKVQKYLLEFSKFEENDIDKNFLDINPIYQRKLMYCKLLIEYKFNFNFDKAFKIAKELKQLFPSDTLFVYYMALIQFKLIVKEIEADGGNSGNYRRILALYDNCKQKFETFVTSPIESKTLVPIFNSYFYLGRLQQFKNEHISALDNFQKILNAISSKQFKLSKFDFMKIFKEIEQFRTIEDHIEMLDNNEFDINCLNFYKIKLLYELEDYEKCEKELNSFKEIIEKEKLLKNKSQNTEQSFSYYGIYYFLGLLKLKQCINELNTIFIENCFNLNIKFKENQLIKYEKILKESIKYFKESKRCKNFENNSRYYIGKCYYFQLEYELANEEFKGQLVQSDTWKKLDMNITLMKLYYEIALNKYKESLRNDGENNFLNSIEQCMTVIKVFKTDNKQTLIKQKNDVILNVDDCEWKSPIDMTSAYFDNDILKDTILLNANKIAIFAYYYLNTVDSYKKLKELIEKNELLSKYPNEYDILYFHGLSIINNTPTNDVTSNVQNITENKLLKNEYNDGKYGKLMQIYL